MLGNILAGLANILKAQPRSTVLMDCAAGPVAAAPPAIDHAQVQELIGKVTQLTSAVAQDVGQHSHSIQSISDNLTTVAQSDPTAVATLVCKLLMANQELQGRLQNAETTLQDHSHRLQVALNTARTDSLTGLMNRRALDEELRRCLADFQRHRRPVSLMMLDVDHFKKLNDTYGHLAGDQALVHVSSVLREQSRATDIVARFGGEEFAIVFTAATAAGVKEKAERLRAAISERTVSFDGKEICVQASAGLAEAIDGETIDGWIRRADEALYTAKKDGRNRSFLATADAFERIYLEPEKTSAPAAVEPIPARNLSESAAELAAEAFADTTFVPCIARRIAEWRRGGATLTIVLLRLDGSQANDASDTPTAPIRRALQLARVCSREMDVVTRWQSDGVAFLLPGSSVADAKTIVRRLKSAAAEAPPDGVKRTPLSFCIGIAEGIEGNDAKRVLERAWMALDSARGAGPGNAYVHDGLKSVGLKLAAAAPSGKSSG